MASTNDIKRAMNDAMLVAMVKYAGGSVKGKGNKKNKAVTAKQAIINSHFISSNKKIYKELSKEYEIQKEKRVPGAPILVFSGAMQKSIVKRAKIKELGNGKFLMSFPKAVAYADAHATGDGVPVRHPTALTNADKKRFEDAIELSLRLILNSLDKRVKNSKGARIKRS